MKQPTDTIATGSRGARRGPCALLAWLIAFVMCSGVIGIGCYPTLRPARQEARVPGVTRITLDGIDERTFFFTVWNETTQPVMIDRSAIRLNTPQGSRTWIQSFMRRHVTVQPGGVHDVKVEFEFDRGALKPGDKIEVDFSSAVISGGRLVPAIPPLTGVVMQ